MILKDLNKIYLALLMFTFCIPSQAQEMLVNLNSNPQLHGYDEIKRSRIMDNRAAGDTLDLPFFEDFSEPFSRLHFPYDLFPSLDRWVDDKVYINNHMAINPRSQGVATFDGLNEYGQAYSFGSALPAPSDSLTSKPLNLGGAVDTVYLSFYYQAQGLGNAPEAEDSLVVEFKDTADSWTTAWKTPGYVLGDNDFRRAMIPVVSERYLYNGFQFRFRNYASLAGSTDHWHVDYIELDDNRSFSDTLVDDLAFLDQTSFVDDTSGLQTTTASLLVEYNSMPWTHFKTDPGAFMNDSTYIMLRNNRDSIFSLNYKYRVRDLNGVELYESLPSDMVVAANRVCGSELNECNADTLDNLRSFLEGFEFPTSPELSSDSSFFLVENEFENTNDAVQSNDKNVFKQEFYNYYSYDDGTAELAYGLGNLEEPGSVALKYDIKMEDTLRAIQLYLNPVAEDLSNETVNLVVWTGNSEPETVLWMSQDTNFYYTNGMNYFYHYELDEPQAVNIGTIYIGWIQQPVTNQIFSVGFDKRTNVSDKLFYNLGTSWAQSSIPGAVMIHPVFGQAYDWQVGVNEHHEKSINVYPNPSTGQYFIQEEFSGQFRNEQISIFDLTGREVFAEYGYKGSIDIQHLNSGTYVLRIGSKHTQRLVLQK